MKLNKKNKILLIVFIVTAYLSYFFSISKTFEIRREYENSSSILKNDLSSEMTIQLVQKEKALDSILKNSKILSTDSFQNQLLKLLNQSCDKYNLKILDFQEPHIIKENNSTTENYPFALNGSFNACILAINNLENGTGVVKHLEFLKTKNYKQNSEELKVNILLQKN